MHFLFSIIAFPHLYLRTQILIGLPKELPNLFALDHLGISDWLFFISFWKTISAWQLLLRSKKIQERVQGFLPVTSSSFQDHRQKSQTFPQSAVSCTQCSGLLIKRRRKYFTQNAIFTYALHFEFLPRLMKNNEQQIININWVKQ